MNSAKVLPTDLTTASATTLAAIIRDGKASSAEVVEAHIAKIKAVDPALNAVIAPTFDAALDHARNADSERARGKDLGPLHGVPVTIKAQFRVADTEMNMGLPHHRGRIDTTEGPLVTALREAGAIVLGKTNIMQLLVAWESDNPVYGRTNNPWNVDRTPGGSSGGEAAIIAANGSPLGLGSDLGGSIRIPAHFCGIHGLKPTEWRLPNDDTPCKDFFATGQTTVRPQPGPMARSVEDLALAMKVMAGAKAKQPLLDPVPPVPWPSAEGMNVKGMKIGFIDKVGSLPPSPAIARAMREAASSLEAMGAIIEPFKLPEMDNAIYMFVYVITADGGDSYKRALGPDKPNHLLKANVDLATIPRFLRPVIAAMLRASGQHENARVVANAGAKSTAEYWRLTEEVNDLRYAVSVAMANQGLDALLCPPFGTVAPEHGATNELVPAAAYAVLFNLLGFPAGVVSLTQVRPDEEAARPTSKNKLEMAARNAEAGSAGLPVGVQVAAPLWREDTVLTIMAALESEFATKPDYPPLVTPKPGLL